jgi:hypothetical protein
LQKASSKGYLTVSISADDVRLHLVHQLFHAVAKQLDWLFIADRFARYLLSTLSIEYPENARLDRVSIASQSNLAPPQIDFFLQRALRQHVLKNPHFSRAFKAVICALTAAAFDSNGIELARGRRVIEWLQGLPTDTAVLKQVNVTRRINRQSGRAFLVDLARFLRLSGLPGLVIAIDMARYSESRIDLSPRYAPTAALDLFETIRQFIDAFDNTSGLFLVFKTSTLFLNDSKRGLSSYAALKMRLTDDVYDSDRPNLMAPLLRLT